jgi:uncharacterized protein (TIGR03067 family)
VRELLGTWEVLEGHFLGEDLPPQLRLIIAGADKMTWKFDIGKGEESHDQVCRVDPTKSPKQIDMGLQEGQGIMAPGIYKIEGNVLTILLGTEPVTGEGAVQRPKGFDDRAMAHYVCKKISGVPRRGSRGKRWWQLWK